MLCMLTVDDIMVEKLEGFGGRGSLNQFVIYNLNCLLIKLVNMALSNTDFKQLRLGLRI